MGRDKTDGNGRVNGLDIALLDEDLAGFEAEALYLLFGDGLASGQLLDLSVTKSIGVRGDFGGVRVRASWDSGVDT